MSYTKKKIKEIVNKYLKNVKKERNPTGEELIQLLEEEEML